MTKLYTTALLLVITLFACKSPGKAFEQGNYTDAVERAVRKLQKDPGDHRTLQVLKDAYSHAVAQREEHIRNLLNSNSDTRYIQVFREYNNLQHLYLTVRQVPSAARAVKATDYASYVETYRNKAAEVHVERANKWMEDENIFAYREAYKELRAAQRLKPDDIDLRKQVLYTYDLAVLKVLVLPMDLYGSNYFYSNSSYQMRNFQDRIVRQLNFHSGDEFVRYFTQWEGRSEDITPDQVLEMRLGRLRIGQPYDQTESRKVEKEVVVKETVYRKDSIVKEYATVAATINTTRRILVSEASLLLTTRDNRGRILWNDEFRGEHRREAKFVTYTGDERALSSSDKELVNNNRPENNRPLREDEIVDDLMRQIENDLAQRLRTLYQRRF